MAYNVSYSTLPTFSTNSIGYNVNNSGTYNYGNNSNKQTVCSFNLGIGVYIITVNIYGLVSSNQYNFWYGSLVNSQGIEKFFSYSPQSIYTTNSFYMSSINFSHIITQSESTTINVQIQSYNMPNRDVNASYNCSLVCIS